MEYTEIQKLIDAMGESKLTDLDIEFADGTKISMKKANSTAVTTNEIPVNTVTSIPTTHITETTAQVVSNVTVSAAEKVESNAKVVKAPMVGTFYSKANPNANAFVTEGDRVEKGQTLCIIEAMKLMNEIESDYAGIVKKVLVKDGEMVEYGQPLFEIEA